MRAVIVGVFLLLGALPTLLAEELSLKVSAVIPRDADSKSGLSAVARLYEYDPRLAGASAKEISRGSKHKITLSSIRKTRIGFELKGQRKKDRSYYVTIFIYPNQKSDERLYFIDGFQKVLEKKNTESIVIPLKPVTR